MYGTMIINANKSVNFTMNSAKVRGGAICIDAGDCPTIIVDNYSKIMILFQQHCISRRCSLQYHAIITRGHSGISVEYSVYQ